MCLQTYNDDSYKDIIRNKYNYVKPTTEERKTSILTVMLRIIQDRLNNETEEKWMHLTHTFSCLERRRTLSLAYIEHDICSMRR